MNEELKKHLTDLIDETIAEIDELKKSRYAAAEIKLKGPGEGIAGKSSDGELDAKKAEDEACKADPDDEGHGEDDPADRPSTGRKLKAILESKKSEDEDEDEEDEDDSDDEMDKAEDEDDSDEDDSDDEMDKAEDKKKSKKDKEPHKDDPKHEEKEKKLARKLLDMHKKEMEKSSKETSSLMKSYVDERIQPLEEKISTIFDLVKQIAEQPIPAKGVSARAVPLMKSAETDATEVLTKSEIASKLFELKKSGTKVDSADIARAEMGHDLYKIVEKYKIS